MNTAMKTLRQQFPTASRADLRRALKKQRLAANPPQDNYKHAPWPEIKGTPGFETANSDDLHTETGNTIWPSSTEAKRPTYAEAKEFAASVGLDVNGYKIDQTPSPRRNKRANRPGTRDEGFAWHGARKLRSAGK